MILLDKNQTLQPPEGTLHSVSVEGAYLLVEYHREIERTPQFFTKAITVVFLNDQGREVARSLDQKQMWFPVLAETKPKPELPPVGFWYRFRAGFDLVLLGLWEMFASLPVKGARQ